jgi:hypothetical protein
MSFKMDELVGKAVFDQSDGIAPDFVQHWSGIGKKEQVRIHVGETGDFGTCPEEVEWQARSQGEVVLDKASVPTGFAQLLVGTLEDIEGVEMNVREAQVGQDLPAGLGQAEHVKNR